MLQYKNTLWTWRLCIDPEDIQDKTYDIERIFDHPLKFLTYEGPVQNNTGSVHIVDQGLLILLANEPNTVTCQLSGNILNGTYTLTSRENETNRWILQKTNKP